MLTLAVEFMSVFSKFMAIVWLRLNRSNMDSALPPPPPAPGPGDRSRDVNDPYWMSRLEDLTLLPTTR